MSENMTDFHCIWNTVIWCVMRMTWLCRMQLQITIMITLQVLTYS